MNVKLFLFSVVTFLMFHANAQLKIGDQPTIQDKSVALDVKGSNGRQGLWLPRVSDTSITGIRALNPPNGLVIYHTPSGKLLLRSNNTWVVFLETALASITAGGTLLSGPDLIYSTSTSGTDFSITGSGSTATWNLPDASATARGLVNTSSQAFLGIKTFNSGVSVLGATGSASNLTLGLTSATTAAAQTTQYLSVDATGKVTLNALNTLTSVTAGGTTMTGPALTYLTSNTGTDFTISGSGNTATWNLPDASATARGLVNTSSQAFLGIKTFNTGVSVLGATGSASNLTLGLTSATAAAAQTTKYLSVDATGKITLNTLNTLTSVTAGGITMTGPALTYLTSNTGTDFSITASGNTATWNLPDASGTVRGVVTTGAQTYAGIKTFSSGAIVSGATGATSNLTLGINAATTPAAQTTKYLSVDATGNVTLNAMNAITSVTAGGPAMTGPALTYNTANSGTDFSITSSGNTATWNLPDASATNRGAITTAAQTLGGLKTFGNGIVVNNGATVSGATTYKSNLTLGVTATTIAGFPTDKYLSVDSAGKVTLNAVNVTSNQTIRIKGFGLSFASNEQLPANAYAIYSFPVPAGMTLSLNATVTVSPTSAMDKNFKINWARVKDATNVEISMQAGSTPNNFNPGQGMAFVATVMEF